MRKVVAVRVTSTRSEAVFELTIPRMNHHSEVDRHTDVPGVGSCTAWYYQESSYSSYYSA